MPQVQRVVAPGVLVAAVVFLLVRLLLALLNLVLRTGHRVHVAAALLVRRQVLRHERIRKLVLRNRTRQQL